MYSRQLNDHLYLIDLKPMGIENFIASYVLKSDRTMIIETGPSTSVGNLLIGLKEIGIEEDEVDYVAVSHIHIDHAGGAGILLKHLPNAKLLAHARGAPHLVRPKKLWRETKKVLGKIAGMYGEIYPVPDEKVTEATDGMVVELSEDVRLKVLQTLGHASHHLSFYEDKDNGIFTGDAAGVYLKGLDVVIPTTPHPFDMEIALESLDRLKKMVPRRLYYTHFGVRDDAVRNLEAYVSKLRLWVEVVLEELKMGKSLEAIYKRVLEEDASTRKAADFIQNHLILRRGVVRQSIKGLIGYLKKTSQADPDN